MSQWLRHRLPLQGSLALLELGAGEISGGAIAALRKKNKVHWSTGDGGGIVLT